MVKNDLKAPRYRKDIIDILNDKDFLKSFNKELDLSKRYSISDLKKVIKTFNETIYENVIEYRDGVKLPEFLGIIFIGTCEPKKLNRNVDFNKSNIFNKVIQSRNWESDDYLAKIFCSTFDIKVTVKNRNIWYFKACRNFSRTVSKTYPDKWKMYHKIDHNKHIAFTFQQNKIKEIVENDNKRMLEFYNEFEFNL